MKVNYIITLIFIFIILVILFNVSNGILNKTSDLRTDGYLVDKILYEKDILYIRSLWDTAEFEDIYKFIRQNNNLNNLIKNKVGKDYILMDYVMYLENSVIHSCHRDQNGSKFNDLEDESYTVIIYIDDMNKCLDIVPKSHHKEQYGVYLYDQTQIFQCKPGDVIIFNANLVHSGSLNSNSKNRRIQLKVTHKNDVSKMKYFHKYYKLQNKHNHNSELSKVIQKKFTCQLPIIADLTQGYNKNHISGNLSWWEKMYSQMFYSNKDFYKIEDAF